MKKDFVPAKEAYRKLNFAKEMRTPVYLYGATGYGKTELVRQFLDGTHAIWVSASDLEWDFSILGKKRTLTPIVIDDLQFLSETRVDEIMELTGREDVWLILIGRMQMPAWLMPLMAGYQMVVIPEKDLHLDKEEILRIARHRGVSMTDEELAFIMEKSSGNAYAVSVSLQFVIDGTPFNDELTEKVQALFSEYLANKISVRWSSALQEFLMQVSVVDSFTLPLAIMITGDDCSARFLEEAMHVGNFIKKEGDTYTIRRELIHALRNKALAFYGLQRFHEYYNNAGLFYETQGDLISALKMYEARGNRPRIRSLLIRNGRRHAGAGNYYELRHYYLELDPAEIESSIVLMSAMSLLYSMLMDAEQSEYWYQKLCAFAERVQGAEKQDAQTQLLWLDLSLPHRGSGKMLDLLKHASVLIHSGRIKLPELSLTSNTPSVMNGGMDFCSWSKKDFLLAETVGKMIEKVLGANGRGLVHMALGESTFEKGGHDYEVLQHLIQAQAEIESSGKTENLFVAIGLQIRLCVVLGKPESGKRLLAGIYERALAEHKMSLLANIKALGCRLALFENNTAEIETWLKEAPDERKEFCTLERYRYLCKVRCYLAAGDYHGTLRLLQHLENYAKCNHRTYILMETQILTAIALRQLNLDWKPIFLQALKSAQEYRFVRVLSSEGTAILPLLKEIKKEYPLSKAQDKVWFKTVLSEAEQFAARYPYYLGTKIQLSPSDFSEQALFILQKQAEGLSARQIAEQMHISERTVKYHATENYRKLNAKGKTDAVQKARSLNLI